MKLSIIVNIFILEHIPNESTRVIRTITCSSRDWFQSPDGGPSSTNLSSKYPLDDNNIHLNFSCISGSDEGIYGCLSDRENRANQICIQVYGEFGPSLLLV